MDICLLGALSTTPLAQLYGAVAGELASATAVVAHRLFGRPLVVLGAVVSVAGFLDLSVAVVATPASSTPSLTARVSTPPGHTAQLRAHGLLENSSFSWQVGRTGTAQG